MGRVHGIIERIFYTVHTFHIHPGRYSAHNAQIPHLTGSGYFYHIILAVFEGYSAAGVELQSIGARHMRAGEDEAGKYSGVLQVVELAVILILSQDHGV